MGSIDSRLRRLEEHDRGGPECSGTASYVVVYGADTPPQKTYPACGRPLIVFRVVYDNEGEGAVADA